MNFIYFWGSQNYEHSGSCAELTCSGITYFACDPLHSYFHEPQKNEIYFLNLTMSKKMKFISYIYIILGIICIN